MSILKLLLLTSCGIALSGCANLKSIHRKSGINPAGQTEFIDAKQRAIVVNPVYTPAVEDHKQSITDRKKRTRRAPPKFSGGDKTTINYNNVESPAPATSISANATSHPMYRMCSEAAPDVFSAYAFSAAAKAAADSDETTKSASGMFGLSSAETAATIERTQTINMLRESMFRTCERWMNGALDERQMNIQTARDQRMMVATLAIEQLTGVVRSKPTILTSSAVSLLGEDTLKLVEKLEEAQKATKDAEATVITKTAEAKAADKAYDDLNTEIKLQDASKKGTCDVLFDEASVAAEAGGGTKKTECETKKAAKTNADTAKATAETDLKKKQENEKRVEDLVEKAAGLYTAVTASGTGGNGNDPSSVARIKAVVDTVEIITKEAFSDQSEIVFSCMQDLRIANINADYRAACLEMVQKQFEANNLKSLYSSVGRSYIANIKSQSTAVLQCFADPGKRNRLRQYLQSLGQDGLLDMSPANIHAFVSGDDILRGVILNQCK